jgi:hypothetical protein
MRWSVAIYEFDEVSKQNIASIFGVEEKGNTANSNRYYFA